MRDLFLLRILLHLAGQRIPLCLDTLLSPLARCLGLVALGLHFLLQNTLTLLLGLGLVDLCKECVRGVYCRLVCLHDSHAQPMLACA